MLRTSQAARQACRGDTQRIRRKRCKFLFIQKRVHITGQLLTIINIGMTFAVNRNGQHILTAFLFEGDVPQMDAHFCGTWCTNIPDALAYFSCCHDSLRNNNNKKEGVSPLSLDHNSYTIGNYSTNSHAMQEKLSQPAQPRRSSLLTDSRISRALMPASSRNSAGTSTNQNGTSAVIIKACTNKMTTLTMVFLTFH